MKTRRKLRQCVVSVNRGIRLAVRAVRGRADECEWKGKAGLTGGRL